MLENYLDLIVNKGKEEKTKVINKKNNLKKIQKKKKSNKIPPSPPKQRLYISKLF